MEQDPNLREKMATIAAKIAHAEDLLDMISIKNDAIEAGISELQRKMPAVETKLINPDQSTKDDS